MLGDLGYVIGPLALGLVADLHGVSGSLALSAIGLVLAGALFARYAPETYRSV